MYYVNGLKGATRIIYEDLNRLLAVDEPVSVSRLASESGYSRSTVMDALRGLRDIELIEMEHKNGSRAEYHIVEVEGETMNASDVFKAVINFASLGGAEWMDRMQIALIAHTIYNEGKHLRRLARLIGGDFQADVEAWIEEQHVLKLSQVWELQEAYQLRDEIRHRVAQAEEKLTR